MWYAWIEAQRMACLAGAWGWPALPGYDWFSQLIQPRPEVPGFEIHAVTIDGCAVPVTERVIDRMPFCTLRGFTRDARALPAAHRGMRADILICAPLAGHHAVMLREMVQTFLADGDVYLTDWTDARDVPLAAGTFGLDDNVLTIERFLSKIGGERLHVVAVCQATTPTLAALARLASAGQRPALSATLMGGPIDSRLNPTALARFAQAHDIAWFRRTWIDTVPPPYKGAGRRVFPGFYQQAMIAAAYPHHKWQLEMGYWTSRAKADADGIARSLRQLSEYAAVLDMDERYFLDTIRVVFHQQLLARGNWLITGRLVRPQDLTSIALCTVEGRRDTVTGPHQTHAAHALCSKIQADWRLKLTIDGDHHDLFTGALWRDEVHPALAGFWRSLVSSARHVRVRQPRSAHAPSGASPCLIGQAAPERPGRNEDHASRASRPTPTDPAQ